MRPTRNTPDEERRRRRRRLWQGLLMGGAAIGLPALANELVRRRAGRPEPPPWGRAHRYAWKYGDVLFQRLGEGPPAVLVHALGPGHDGHEWSRVAQELGRRRRVLVPDLLGWGRSDKPRSVLDSELYIQLLTDFVIEVVREPAVLVAAGMSAAYAVQVAVDQPEHVAALGLVVPLGLGVHDDQPDLRDAVVHRLLRLPVVGTSTLNLYTSRPRLAHYLRREAFAAGERVDAALLEHHYRSSHQSGAHAALAAYLAGYLNHGVAGALPRLAAPTWLAWGRQASEPPVEDADLWLKHLHGAELDVFEEAGNLPHAEVPGYFALRLERFLDGATLRQGAL
jgi:pimeloyl-ACP methyl ester carboxylesterase